MPWAEDQDNDDELHHDVTPGEPESDEDDNFGARSTASLSRPFTYQRCMQ